MLFSLGEPVHLSLDSRLLCSARNLHRVRKEQLRISVVPTCFCNLLHFLTLFDNFQTFESWTTGKFHNRTMRFVNGSTTNSGSGPVQGMVCGAGRNSTELPFTSLRTSGLKSVSSLIILSVSFTVLSGQTTQRTPPNIDWIGGGAQRAHKFGDCLHHRPHLDCKYRRHNQGMERF